MIPKDPKYFIPRIGDIHLGYECEKRILDYSRHLDFPNHEAYEAYNITPSTEYEKYIVDAKALKLLEVFNSAVGVLRTPYLFAEQIEGEGWEITYRDTKPPPYQVDWINAKKGRYSLWINLALRKSMHMGIDREGILYRGQCKDINTFRYICKLLGIC